MLREQARDTSADSMRPLPDPDPEMPPRPGPAVPEPAHRMPQNPAEKRSERDWGGALGGWEDGATAGSRRITDLTRQSGDVQYAPAETVTAVSSTQGFTGAPGQTGTTLALPRSDPSWPKGEWMARRAAATTGLMSTDDPTPGRPTEHLAQKPHTMSTNPTVDPTVVPTAVPGPAGPDNFSDRSRSATASAQNDTRNHADIHDPDLTRRVEIITYMVTSYEPKAISSTNPWSRHGSVSYGPEARVEQTMNDVDADSINRDNALSKAENTQKRDSKLQKKTRA